MNNEISYTIVRALILGSLILLVGLVGCFSLVKRHGPTTESQAGRTIDGWLERLPGLLAWFLLGLSMLRGALQVLQFSFPGEPLDPEFAKAVLTSDSWGMGWILQTSGAFILLALSWLLRKNRTSQYLAVAFFAGLVIIAQGGMGHSADTNWHPAVFGRLIHSAHVVGGGLWLGTLAVLAMAVVPSLKNEENLTRLRSVIDGYSLLARWGVTLVVATGVVSTWHYTTHIVELPDTAWGRLLILKLITFGAVGLVGLWNWRRATPRLASHSSGGAADLAKTISVELIIGLAIVGLTAVLSATATPIDLVGP